MLEGLSDVSGGVSDVLGRIGTYRPVKYIKIIGYVPGAYRTRIGIRYVSDTGTKPYMKYRGNIAVKSQPLISIFHTNINVYLKLEF